MYTFTAERYNILDNYHCNITVRIQDSDASLIFPPSKEEITDEDINTYINDNIDWVNRSIFDYQENLNYLDFYDILKSKIRYFDINGFEMENITEEMEEL